MPEQAANDLDGLFPGISLAPEGDDLAKHLGITRKNRLARPVIGNR